MMNDARSQIMNLEYFRHYEHEYCINFNLILAILAALNKKFIDLQKYKL